MYVSAIQSNYLKRGWNKLLSSTECNGDNSNKTVIEILSYLNNTSGCINDSKNDITEGLESDILHSVTDKEII